MSNEAMREALAALVEVIDAAGLLNLSKGVQLGPTVWYVKASERLESARAALRQQAVGINGLTEAETAASASVMGLVRQQGGNV